MGSYEAPLLQPIQVPLHGTLQPVGCTTQLGVICKLAEGALDPAVYVTNEDIKNTSASTDL